MRKFLLASVFGLAMAPIGAFAADLPMASPAPMAPALFNWNGFYVGAHVGGGWDEISSDGFNQNGVFTAHTSFSGSGVFGGGQVGYNYMLMPNLLLGAEADVSGGDLGGSVSGCDILGCAHSKTTIDAFGSVRARVGYAMDNWLLYATGGLGWMDSETKRTITCIGVACPGVSAPSVLVGQTAGASGTDLGWALGAGVEWAFTPNWSLQLQYLHLQFDSVTRDYSYTLPAAFRHVVSSDSIDTAQVGINYRF